MVLVHVHVLVVVVVVLVLALREVIDEVSEGEVHITGFTARATGSPSPQRFKKKDGNGKR